MTDAHSSVEDAIAGAAAGEARGFEVLWREFNPPLRRYLRVAAPDAGDDLSSETWLKVARDIRRFRGDAQDFRRWFFTIARHQVIDYHRKRSRSRSDLVSAHELSGRFDRADPADPIAEGLSTAAALDLIAMLPRDQAEAVALRVVAGLTVEQAAKVMGKRPGTVRVLAHRGLRALADRLGGTAEENLPDL